jgi:HK97 gp10 family phage protein
MVKGLSEFQRRWKAVPELVKEAAKEALQQNAEEIVADMRKLAPVGETGDLLVSIKWTWGDAPKGTMAIGTVGDTESSDLKITVYAGGNTAFYARFQEFGTVNMTANPFFYPVWRARRKRVKSRLTRAINKAIKSA